MSTPDARRPARIEQHDVRTLVIEWADGASSLIDVRALRLACGCAGCVDEWTGAPLLAPESVPEDVAPLSIHSVGHYAIRIDWSDGHSDGIYPFERLRRLADQGLLAARDGEAVGLGSPSKRPDPKEAPSAGGDGSSA